MRCRPNGLALGLVIVVAMLLTPLAAEAQQAGKVTRIGYLSFHEPRPLDDVLRRALRDLGWVEGENLVIEYRSAGQDLQRLRPLAEELVRLRVALIVASTGRAALAAKEVTSSVPIVMAASGDAVSQGLVASLARPGGNVTGVTRLRRVLTFHNPDAPVDLQIVKATREAARQLKVELLERRVTSVEELRAGLRARRVGEADAYFSGTGAMVISQSALVIDTMRARKLPSTFSDQDSVVKGGLASYGVSRHEMGRLAAKYA